MFCASCNTAIPKDSFICLECGKLQESIHTAVIQSYIDELVDKATSAYEEKKYEEAIELFSRALEVEPEDKEVRQWLIDLKNEYGAISEIINKAKQLLNERKYQAAEEAARKALEMAPGMAEAQEVTEKVHRSITELDDALSTGKAYLDTNRFEQALEKFNTASEIDPYSNEIVQLKQRAEGLLTAWEQEMDRLEKFNEEHAFGEAIAFAEKMLLRRPFDEELTRFISETRNSVKTIEDNRELGEKALVESRWKDAHRAWDNVLSIIPEDKKAREKRDKAIVEESKERAARKRLYVKLGILGGVALIVLIVTISAMLNRRRMSWGKEFLRLGQPEKAMREFNKTGTFFISTKELQNLKNEASYLINLNVGNEARRNKDWEAAKAAYEEASIYSHDRENLDKLIKLIEISELLENARRHAGEEDFSKAIVVANTVKSIKTDASSLPEMKSIISEAGIAIDTFRTEWLKKAKKLLEDKKYLAASKELRSIISKCRKDKDTQSLFLKCRDKWIEHAAKMRENNEWNDAILEYQRMSVSFPGNAVVEREMRATKASRLIYRGQNALDDEKFHSALKQCREAVQIAADISDLCKQASEIIDRANAAIKERYALHMEKALEAIDKGKLETARNELKEALYYRETEEAKNLGQTVNDRLATPEGMIYIPAGKCIIGDSKQAFWKREGPAHSVELGAYYVDKYPVTNAQYMEFVKATKHRKPAHWVEAGGRIPEGRSDHPVTYVSLKDATAFAAWCGKRLLSEEEWENAARGAKGNVYPWGDNYQKEMANDENAGIKSTSPVGAYPRGASSSGCHDMAGNVWEWTSSKFKLYPGSEDEMEQGDEKLQIVKGGCYTDDKLFIRSSFRELVDPEGAFALRATLGFRCATDVNR